MGNRVFVGNLPYSASSSQLGEHFEAYGQVRDARIMSDRDTGQSRGFGFVTFHTDDMAAEAIERGNGSEFMGRSIVVSEAIDKRNGVQGTAAPRPQVQPARPQVQPARPNVIDFGNAPYGAEAPRRRTWQKQVVAKEPPKAQRRFEKPRFDDYDD